MRDVSVLTDNGVDLESAIELLGDLSFYDETIEDFVAEQDERILKLEEYLANQDMENYAILVHALKSDSKYLGFKKLAELSYEQELASKANNVDEVKEKIGELKKESERITKIAKEYLK